MGKKAETAANRTKPWYRTKGRTLGRYTPRSTSEDARWRFGVRRRAELLRRVAGEPDAYQADLIDAMIQDEWQARLLGIEAETASDSRMRLELLRLQAEYNRQYRLADRDLARSTKRPVVVVERPPTPSEIFGVE